MIGYYSVIFLAIIQIIAAQDSDNDNKNLGPPPHSLPPHSPPPHIPQHCWQPPRDANPFECCPIPSSFSESDFETCGIRMKDLESPKRPRNPDCSKSMCLLNITNQLNPDGTINFANVASQAEKLANDNADFKEAILAAKERCLKDNKAPPGPPHICEADRIFHCMTFNVMWDCKPKEELTKCQNFKNHIDQCKQYYVTE